MICYVFRSLVLLSLSASCGLLLPHSGALAADPRSAGTIKMAERLAEIQRTADPLKNPFLNRARAALFGRQLDELLKQRQIPINRLISLRFKYGHGLLHAGDSAAAIKQFETLNQLIRERRVNLPSDKAEVIAFNAILAYLRLGEQENCLERHTTDSCLVPIQASGFHKKPEGSAKAAQLLEDYLERNPGDLRAGWLLNLAYMTLGKHPHDMPQKYVISPRVFESEHPLPRFHDIAGGLALAWNSLAGSVVMDDLDNDHDLDLMISGMGLDEELRLYINNGDGTFSETAKQAGLEGELGGLNLIQADYDNDGDIDIFVLRGGWFEAEGKHPNSLLRNRGDATFDDVTEAAGVLSFHPTQAATWLDFDGDGWIDLFIGNETTPNAKNPCELFRNQGDGTFEEIAQEVGLTGVGLIKAVGSGDFNNDGRMDIYISCRGQANFLYRNDGPASEGGRWRFTDVAKELKVQGPEHSFPTWFFDFDNDGWLDIFACGYGVKDVGSVAADYLGLRHGAARPRLYRNAGDGTFEDVTRKKGLFRLLLGMSGNYGDLDNDGFLDFYIGTGTPQLDMIVPNRMLRNDRGKKFQDVTTAGGFGYIQKGHGIAFGDLDHDGDQDIFVSMGGAYEGDRYFNALFENPGNQHSWIKLKLVGVKSNRAAIGARIIVFAHSSEGMLTIHRTVSSGGSFGASPLRQEIGLGPGVERVDLKVQWPASGVAQEFKGLSVNTAYLIMEGESEIKKLLIQPATFAKEDSGHEHSRH
ncbi:MAG: hypothetical protein M2R45_04883 [Verrucomicrobia subdivision 3 bacterium]|nr:hypothetical protein [Limisphaerales bacterium]MCS1414377.1 hypothetical protein [Limisphaerales bacterium]